ncbi:hypothetical protein K402DRAFT_22308 [Aulographum hederae CBS 113979]|uniref:Rho1 guanine nucleotide exchange factor 3 n=1 Tax=Aulographum hederae CBS 113979 TaxID=1176131 RepID=A0A6G1H7A0_9PEZI|nr:hypothetical protein K402DRAFT_22308 [Aulographum hederae CBS 113979]
MAQYQNGQQYYGYGSPPDQPPASQYPSQYTPSADNYGQEPGNQPPYGIDTGNAYGDSYAQRRTGTAQQQSDELFIGGSGVPPPPPRTSTSQSLRSQYQAAQPAYNPQAYASPSSQSPPRFSAHRLSTAGHPQAYNPADYSGDLQRQGSISAYPQHYPQGAFSPTSSQFSPTSQSFGFASPTQTQPPYASARNSRTSIYGGAHAPHPAPPPVPPRLASVPVAPPLPTILDSATSPGDDWQQFPSGNRATSQSYAHYPDPYQRHSSAPSPPLQRHGSRQSSSGQGDFQSPSPFSDAAYNMPPTPGPPPPAHSPRRNNTTRHPTNNPLPGLPQEAPGDSDYFGQSNGRDGSRYYPGQNFSDESSPEEISQADLYDEVERAVMGPGSSGMQSPRIEVEGTEDQDPQRSHSGRSGSYNTHQDYANGHLTPESARYPRRPFDEDDGSDAEAAAGVEAMRVADEEEAEDRRRAGDSNRRESTGGYWPGFAPLSSHRDAPPSTPNQFDDSTTGDEDDDDAEFGAGVDMSSLGGGFLPPMSHGGDAEELIPRNSSLSKIQSHGQQGQPLSQSSSLRQSDSNQMYDYGDALGFARTDTFGTGGLSEPGEGRRRSYDEGDDGTEPMHDPFIFHPGMSSTRPLPPTPGNEYGHQYSHSASGPYPQDWRQNGYNAGRSSYPAAPEGYVTQNGPTIPRTHVSLSSHASTPHTLPPIRSKTDAEERRLRGQQPRSSAYLGDSGNESAVTLDLPTLPARGRYNPAKLTTADFQKCQEPWALSCIISWLKLMTEGEQYLREEGLVEGLLQLFTHKVPTMKMADAETLAARVVQEMEDANVLDHEEEWINIGNRTMTGVLYQLTGSGCYSSKVHSSEGTGRCYAHHCQRIVKKIDLHQHSTLNADGWMAYYNIKMEDLQNVDKKKIDYQNIMYEVVQKEETYMKNLMVLQQLYRDALRNAQPAILPPKKLEAFINDAFGKVDDVKNVNEEYLLPQLKYRQQEQGPWVIGFSDIFREWIRKAKNAYIAYAAAFPRATFKIREEKEKNMLFKNFIDTVAKDPRSNRLGWDNFLKSPITRLQQYGLLLQSALLKMREDSQEKTNLALAIEEIRLVTNECDARVGEMDRKVSLTYLQNKLQLRPDMSRVELNLEHLGRELLYQGDLQRMGQNKFSWVDQHALLFDHYLVLAKTIIQRNSDGSVKSEMYDVSRLPIPMDLLVLESRNDDPVQKSGVKGPFASVSVVPQRPGAIDTRHRSQSNQSPIPGQLSHSNTSTSLASLATTNSARTTVTTTVLDPKDDRILYPFRIKHLGKEIYTLYAPTSANRDIWCDKIEEAKTRHAASLFTQNAEPFRLRVMADSAFGYESAATMPKTIMTRGTPLDRAIRDVEKLYASTGRPVPICRARVNCATAFQQSGGAQMVAVGTDNGVYISQMDNPRGWAKVIPANKVTQIAVLEEFSLFLLIADKSLIAYHLDVVCPVGGGPPNNDSARRAPQKLSGSRDVGFFATGKMKDRTLVFYKKKDGISSTFKVLEPVLQKSTERRSRFGALGSIASGRSGRTEFFREYDEFYIPTECHAINLFSSSLAVSSVKGFEVLTLDKKQPVTIPDLRMEGVQKIALRLQNQQPLGMFRLPSGSEGSTPQAGGEEFLLCYEECAVYINKLGEISRSVIMEFVGKAKAAAVYGPYVLLFDHDFVEVRNALNGRLRQVISGRDVRCLDDGLGGQNSGGQAQPASGKRRSVKVGMQHPEIEKCQIVVELVLNENLRE